MFPERVELLPSDECAIFGAWLNVLLIGSQAPEHERTFVLAEQNLASILRRHPRGAALVLMVLHADKPPENYVQRATRLLHAFRPQLLGAAGVFEMHGFTAAAQRAVGSTLIRLASLGTSAAMFGDIDGAVGFLAPRVFALQEVAVGTAALRLAAGNFRESVRAGRGPTPQPRSD
jgi:hypothetical protein